MNIYIKIIIVLIVFSLIAFYGDLYKLIIKIHRLFNYIDKDTCYKIMCDFDDICKKNDVKYFLSEGTALGIYRDGDLIDWDDDIDFAMDEENSKKFVEYCVPEFVKNGYLYMISIAYTNLNMLSFIKYFHSIDVDRIIVGEKCTSKCGKLCDELLPHIQRIEHRYWRGRMWPVPSESYYEYLYGKNWKIPKKTKNQNN